MDREYRFSKKNNSIYVVNKKTKKKRLASPHEKKCYTYLSKTITKNIILYKKKKLKNIGQALAIAYGETNKKYPNCISKKNKKNT